MKSSVHLWIKSLAYLVLANLIMHVHAQTHWVGERPTLLEQERDGDSYRFNRELLIDVWFDLIREENAGFFGATYDPTNNRNLYLTYNYEIADARSRATIGFSVNHLNAVTLNFSHFFTLDDL